MRLVLALSLLLALPASAAADVTLTDQSGGGVRYGAAQKVAGRVTDAAGAGVPAAVVRVEARPFPYTSAFAAVGTVTTGATGRFTFSRSFPRNTQLRAIAVVSGEKSHTLRTYVFPAVTLTFQQLSPHRLKLIQTYKTPAAVELRAPTIFYLGPGKAKTAGPSARGETRRVRAGRFRSTAKVSLPDAWKGSFKYGSCFRYTKGSGMGDPKAGCPKRYRF
jgi:hypothetical protein